MPSSGPAAKTAGGKLFSNQHQLQQALSQRVVLGLERETVSSKRIFPVCVRMWAVITWASVFLQLSWAVKIKKRLKPVAPFLGKFRPVVGKCCHQCTPKSLDLKLLKTSPALGFQNLLDVNETYTRYRGWLVRRLCCVLFVGGCRVYPSSAEDRLDRVCASSRVQKLLSLTDGMVELNGQQHHTVTTRGCATHILPIIDTCISPVLLRVSSWVLLKLLNAVFCSVQVNLSQMAALHRATELVEYSNPRTRSLPLTHRSHAHSSLLGQAPEPRPRPGRCSRQEERPLVFVSILQCGLDYALIPLVLFCHNLRVPYTVYHLQLGNTWLRLRTPLFSPATPPHCGIQYFNTFMTRLSGVLSAPLVLPVNLQGKWMVKVKSLQWLQSVLRRLGVILLPPHPVTEQDAEKESLYGPIMTSFVAELLRDGQSLSLTLDPGSGRGGQWLARVWEAVRDGMVPDVNLVPVSVAYDCPPSHGAPRQGGLLSLLRYALSMLCGGQRGSVRVHIAQAFSLKETFETERCRVDGGHPLQELLLPAIFKTRSDAVFGQKCVSWVLPPSCCPELPPAERQFTVALTLHLLYSTASCTAVMSTSLVSCLLLHKHRKVNGCP
ncbi:hypothetical protein JZ751_001568, partial [Albula glossodonta]